jgi:hypothetical protein
MQQRMATSLLRTAHHMIALIALVALAAPAAAECSVGGSTSEGADVARARTACEAARARFGQLFGDSAPSVHIALHDGGGYEVANAGAVGIVFWPNSRGLVPGGTTASRAWLDAQWAEVLPHEIMHALTMAQFYSDGDVNGHGGYGTPLPDWFEEGIAIWGEPRESREGRLAQARALPGHRRELFGILRGAHPVAANPTLIEARPGATVPQDEALRAFYPQAIAILSFLFDHGGPAAMRELARRLVRDPGDEGAVLALPGLPDSHTALLGAWERWLIAERP